MLWSSHPYQRSLWILASIKETGRIVCYTAELLIVAVHHKHRAAMLLTTPHSLSGISHDQKRISFPEQWQRQGAWLLLICGSLLFWLLFNTSGTTWNREPECGSLPRDGIYSYITAVALDNPLGNSKSGT